MSCVGGWSRGILGLLSFAVFGSVISGCADSLPPPSDSSQVGTLVGKALDAWKGGASSESVSAGGLGFRVMDNDWRAGATLIGYELKGEPERYGLELLQPVALEIRTRKGKVEKKVVNYLVTTGSSPVVMRQDIDE